MDASVALHVIAPSGRGRARIEAALEPLRPVVHDSVDTFRRDALGDACAVVVDVDGGVESRALLDLCCEVADERREWIVLLPEDDGAGGVTLRPLSTGFPMDPGSLRAFLDDDQNDTPPLELHHVLRAVARVRHDINNPLTAGMAETQLLLMDVGDDDEARESLETVHRQLERIQNLVKEMRRLRRPAKPEKAGSGTDGRG